MDKLFLTVLNMSLTGAFVIAAICIARLPLKKAPKIISYCLWAVAGFRLVFPYSIESVFSLLPFNAQAIPPDIAMQPVPRIDSGIPFLNNAVSDILPAATPAASVNPLQLWATIGAFVWLAGVVIMLIYGIASFMLLKRKMMKASHIETNIYEAQNIKSPFVLGVFKPIIYLPIGLSEQEKSYIILHEQTHIKRHDHIIKFITYFVLCLHWFNPFVWAAFLLMSVDMEMSCDERVLKEMGGKAIKNYSLSLLSLATEKRIIGGSPLCFGEGGIKERIKNVLNFKKPSRVIIVAAVSLAAVLSVGFAVNRVIGSANKLTEYEVVYNDITEYSYAVQFKLGNTLYSDFIIDGQLQTASSTRGLKEIGFAAGSKDDKYRIFERAGYSTDEFIVVQDNGFMNPATIYKAEHSGQEGMNGQQTATGDLHEIAGAEPLTSDEVLNKIYLGMTNEEVYEFFGEPDYQGSGLYFYGYHDVGRFYFSGNFYENSGLQNDAIATQIIMNDRSWDINELVSTAVKQHNKNVFEAEFATESHIDLALDANQSGFTMYVISLYEAFVPDGEYDVKLVGSTHAPLALTFTKNANGDYELSEYRQAQYGDYSTSPTYSKIPKDIWDKFSTQLYTDSLKQNCYDEAMFLYTGAIPSNGKYGVGTNTIGTVAVTRVADCSTENGYFTIKYFPGATLQIEAYIEVPATNKPDSYIIEYANINKNITVGKNGTGIITITNDLIGIFDVAENQYAMKFEKYTKNG